MMESCQEQWYNTMSRLVQAAAPDKNKRRLTIKKHQKVKSHEIVTNIACLVCNTNYTNDKVVGRKEVPEREKKTPRSWDSEISHVSPKQAAASDLSRERGEGGGK